jgi:septum formation protein
VVVDGGRVLGKPRTVYEATSMLVSLAGKRHEVYSGLALCGDHGTVSGVGRASVRFRRFDPATAQRYAETGEPDDKAGAYGIQGLGAALVDAVDGDYYSVVGFPVSVFVDLLERAGWRYDFGTLTRLPV